MPDSGLDQFLAYLEKMALRAPDGWSGAVWFILRIGEDCAGIYTEDVGEAPAVLRTMASAPPLQFGPDGFSAEIVDDHHPARHYIAFVFVGFWLPQFLAILLLYAWEAAGFVRYRGQWSRRDVVSGRIGIEHGGWVRRTGPAILPGLVAASLAEHE